jgi:hypothetical protein
MLLNERRHITDGFRYGRPDGSIKEIRCRFLGIAAAKKKLTLFNSSGGNNTPVTSRIWGAIFGVFTDKFGVRWMLNYDKCETTKPRKRVTACRQISPACSAALTNEGIITLKQLSTFSEKDIRSFMVLAIMQATIKQALIENGCHFRRRQNSKIISFSGKLKPTNMNILITILIVLGSLIALLLIIALLTKKEFSLEKQVIINKPKQEVFNYLKLIRNQERYSVWVMKDPHVKMIYTGSDGTVGFTSSWESNDKNVGIVNRK